MWETSISTVEAGKVTLRGYRIEDMMGRVPYADAVYLVLTGRFPTPAQARLVDAMLVSCVDHGVAPHSTTAGLTVAATRAPLTSSMAAGILAMGPMHGGAIDPCARMLHAAIERIPAPERGDPESIRREAEAITESALGESRRIPGFGHLLHRSGDPRTKRLLELAADAGINGPHVALLEAIRVALTRRGKGLPVNIDGAMAAVSLDIGIPPEGVLSLFILSRAAGLAAHHLEEVRTMRPMRTVEPTRAVYSGPTERDLPERYLRGRTG